MVVLVVFKLVIDNIELVDNEIKLENINVFVVFKFDVDVVCVFNIPNIVVDVAFKLFIDNVALDDKLFKFLLVAYTDKLGVFILCYYNLVKNMSVYHLCLNIVVVLILLHYHIDTGVYRLLKLL